MAYQVKQDDSASHEELLLRANVLLEVGLTSPYRFTRNGHVLQADVAFQSAPLVRNLLKLGLFSMNLNSMISVNEQIEEDKLSYSRVPSFLLAVGLHYAIDVAPLDPASPAEDMVISLDALDAQVARLEKTFGTIAIDTELLGIIPSLARERLAPDPEGPAAEGVAQ